MAVSRHREGNQLKLLSKDESSLRNLCTATAKYANVVAKLRGQGDDIATQLHTLSTSAIFEPHLKNKIFFAAQCVSQVQDYRSLQVERLERQVVPSLHACATSCRQARSKRTSFAANNSDNPKLAEDRKALQDRCWRALRDLLQTELASHVRAVELYSQACSQILAKVDTEPEHTESDCRESLDKDEDGSDDSDE
ncbi:CBY1-interacting BAR domain-containing protein 2 [Hyalella azteca]|uniref:CBY1-interacting BAR domain-containing protein 2 n=1 Tax=Hyalella azteca TaxID=294128 RepID=A0A8B7NIR5_HYAAZ|nr:CBY1-interacting BAR domain-containing protein 2 [Hyalella azteca]